MSKRPAKKSAPTPASKPKRKPATAIETSSDESEASEEDDDEYIFKAVPHHQHLQEQEAWNTVVNTKKIKREERYERKKEREAELAAAVAAEQERYRQQAATNPYANLLAKPTPQYNAFGRKKIGPKVHKYVHSPEDEEEFVIQTNFEKVQQKKAERAKKSSQPSKPAIQIQSETDLVNTIVGILDRSPEPYLPVATAAAELAKLTKTSWQDTYKRQYGPIATFLTSHPDTFALIDGDKLFLKPRLEAFLQTTIGRPKKKKVEATDDGNNADGKKKKKNKQNGHVDGENEDEQDESEHPSSSSSSSSSSSTCGRCCSTLFLLLLSLVLVAIICLVILSIKRVTVEEAFTRLHRLFHPYIQRIQLVIKPYIDQLAVYITSASQQIKERWQAFQSKQAS